MVMMRLKSCLFALLSVGLLNIGTANAVDVFEPNTTLKLVVGFSAGGAVDITARNIARFMGQYIPGQPKIIVQNMPGAGSMKAAVWLGSQAPKDGSVFGSLSPSVFTQPLIGISETGFLPSSLAWIGSADSGEFYCLNLKKDGIDTSGFDHNGPTKEFIIGATATVGNSGDFSFLLRNIMGPKIKVVLGYEGITDVIKAMEAGEVDGLCGMIPAGIYAQMAGYVKDGRLNYLLAFAKRNREISFKSAANINDYLRDEDQPAADFIFSQSDFARPFAAPSGVPKDRLDVLRDAFMKTVTSDELNEALGRSEHKMAPVSGQELEKINAQLSSAPPKVLERVKQLLAPVD